MKKSLQTAIALSLLLLLAVNVAQFFEVAGAQPKTIVVPDYYPTIQGAIDAAKDGDTILVKKGLYNETLVIEKSISLIGEDRNFTVIDAGKAHTQVIAIRGNNITIANFTLGNTSHHVIRNSGDFLATGEGDGIVVYTSKNVTIVNNTIVDCPTIGIYLYASTSPVSLDNSTYPNVNVIGNSIFLCSDAILINTVDCYVVNNTYAKNAYGVRFEYYNIIVGPGTTSVVLKERNVVQGNKNITETATIPSPFPSQSPSPSPSPTSSTSPLNSLTQQPTLEPTSTAKDNQTYLVPTIIVFGLVIAAIVVSLLAYAAKSKGWK